MKSVLLIGLGRFGRHIAMKLSELKHQTLAIDNDEERVEQVLPYVTSAQIGDCTNPTFISSLGVRDFDVCIVAIGDDFQSSLEVTSLLKENGFQYVIEFCKNKFPTYYGHHRKDAEVYIISEDMPSMKCINAVMKEGTNETEEEKDMLRKCLLIYETLFSGIYPLS